MGKQVRYWGEFDSVDGVRWRVELLQETDGIERTPKEIFFPSSPLTIEWGKCGKLDVIEASSATLIVESDTDRQFIDLYQVEFGAIMLNIYRAGVLYWSGTLDTELYEEPYSYNSHYDVTLTFSDLAPLERLKWQLNGCLSTMSIVEECLRLSQIDYINIVKHISTIIANEIHILNHTVIDRTYNLCENFYDEEGEPMTVKEVLEAVLQPFALKIRQKAGRIYIYDINKISQFSPKAIHWDSTDATLSVDETYNNITLTFSPYADTTILSGEQDPDLVAPNTTGELIHTDYNSANGQFLSPEGFRFNVSWKGGENLQIAGTALFFRIQSEYSGSNEAGVAMTAKTFSQQFNKYVSLYGLQSAKSCMDGRTCTSSMIMRTTQPKFISSIGEYDNFKLKVTLELLFDVRYNPFEQKQIHNEQGNWQKMQDWCNFGYVPIKLYITNDQGSVISHFDNQATLWADGYEDHGVWVDGDTQWGDCFLAYYNKDDRRSSTGFGGWAKNRPMIGYFQGDLPSSFNHIGEGQIIPMPPVGGWLVMEVGSGVYQFDYKRGIENIYPMINWVLYKGPLVKIVKSNGLDFSPEDIEIKAWLNKAAKEDLAISTVVGTMTKPFPSARGLLLDSQRHSNMQFSRAGNSDTLERLLIATAYSHYASKHDILSGTVKLLPSFGVYTDANTAGKFMVMSEVQRPVEETSEITLVQINEDNHKGLKFDE